MDNYKFTVEELEILKVAKLNQNKSESLKVDIDSVNESMQKNIQSHDDFLAEVEAQMGIVNNKKIKKSSSFIREGPRAESINWEELLENSNHVINPDIGFEDLLSKDEFENAYNHIEEIDKVFKKKTGLRKNDLAILTVAIALQCARQYVLDPWIKDKRVAASSNDEKDRKNNAEPGWYHADTEKILTSRVPFDVQQYGSNISIHNFLKGGDHRHMTLGHDPVLGWIFGTANIMTNTVTRIDFVSAHVKVINNQNKIHSNADTTKVFTSVFDRVQAAGEDGKIALACSIVREAIHLKSDINTKRSLPLPVINTLSPDLGKTLAKYGVDTASVGTEITLSSIINMLISMIHRMSMDDSKENEEFYEVRTRKIILYSNSIASTSNIIATHLTKNYKQLDVGGLLVTISRLISDVRFISRVKGEFVQSELDIHFSGIQEEIDSLYETRFS